MTSLPDSDFFSYFYSLRYKVAITKHKDFEQTCSSLYSQNNMWDPVVDFSNYIQDNENIVNEVSMEKALELFHDRTVEFWTLDWSEGVDGQL